LPNSTKTLALSYMGEVSISNFAHNISG